MPGFSKNFSPVRSDPIGLVEEKTACLNRLLGDLLIYEFVRTPSDTSGSLWQLERFRTSTPGNSDSLEGGAGLIGRLESSSLLFL